MLAAGAVLSLGVASPARAQVFMLQHNFTNTPDGANPRQLVWLNGIFYGSTANGGANGNGSIFAFDPNGAGFAPVYQFTGAPDNGSAPNNLLVADNVIYGTTLVGGTNGVGMIFAVNADGSGFRSLYSFALAAPDGNYPQAGLIADGGTLYGTTHTGGTNGGGTLFKINTNGAGYAILHWFTTNAPDGFSPQSELVLSDGTLYGTTAAGGGSNLGTVFAINTNGTGYTTLHSFTNSPDGANSFGGLVLNAGVLYGTTDRGGTCSNGAVFAMNTDGSGYEIIHNFTGYASNTDGEFPKSTLTFNAGCLYGTASSGGVSGGGTLFRIGTNGAGFAVIRSFTNHAVTGSDLENGVVALGNNVWGTAYAGGTGYGVLYSMQLSPVPATNLAIVATGPASFSVSGWGAASQTYGLYASTNLAAPMTNWWLIGTTNSDVGGWIQFLDTQATNQRRFYRFGP